VLASFVVHADARSHNLRSASIARYEGGTHSYKDQHNRRPVSHRKPFQLVVHVPLPHPKSRHHDAGSVFKSLERTRETNPARLVSRKSKFVLPFALMLRRLATIPMRRSVTNTVSSSLCRGSTITLQVIRSLSIRSNLLI